MKVLNSEQEKLADKHAKNPEIGDIWFQGGSYFIVVVWVTAKHVYFCEDKINTTDVTRMKNGFISYKQNYGTVAWMWNLGRLKAETRDCFARRYTVQNSIGWTYYAFVKPKKSPEVLHEALLEGGFSNVTFKGGAEDEKGEKQEALIKEDALGRNTKIIRHPAFD